jgi:hypothetical protein
MTILYVGVWLYQKFNPVLVLTDKRKYELRYILHDFMYRIRIHTRRGPHSVMVIKNENDEDVTDEVLSYMGPNEDWHGQMLTPSELGYRRLQFLYRSGTIKEFDANNVMI